MKPLCYILFPDSVHEALVHAPVHLGHGRDEALAGRQAEAHPEEPETLHHRQIPVQISRRKSGSKVPYQNDF